MRLTVSRQAVEELKWVIAYRDSELGGNAPKFLGLALSARKNLCINEKVMHQSRGGRVVCYVFLFSPSLCWIGGQFDSSSACWPTRKVPQREDTAS